jgi:AbrB family looped-hinge helix DNA binding protein
MSTVCKIQHKGQVTIPTLLRNQAGLSKGDLVEFSFLRGKIVITPKVVIDRSKFPNADDEYTPEQRRIIDGGIRQGLEDFKSGRSHGPFATAEEARDYIERVAKAREAAVKTVKRTRR